MGKSFRKIMNTDTYKFRFDIVVNRIEFETDDVHSIPSPDELVCEISRKVKHIVVTNPKAVSQIGSQTGKLACNWQCAVVLYGTFALQDMAFQRKEYAFKVRMLEDEQNSITTLAKAKLDLSQFCSMASESFEVGLPLFGSHNGTLYVTITASWIKNNKKRSSGDNMSITSFGSISLGEKEIDHGEKAVPTIRSITGPSDDAEFLDSGVTMLPLAEHALADVGTFASMAEGGASNGILDDTQYVVPVSSYGNDAKFSNERVPEEFTEAALHSRESSKTGSEVPRILRWIFPFFFCGECGGGGQA